MPRIKTAPGSKEWYSRVSLVYVGYASITESDKEEKS
jgi:hypothetical protein